MRHVALSGQQADISSLAKIHNHHRMRLRPAVVNHMFDPFAITGMLQPENAVSVGHRGHNIRPAIAVHVDYVHEAEGVGEIPASRSQYVVAAVPVYITDSNPMTVAVVADNVLHDSAVFIPFVPGKWTIVSELRQNLFGLAVVIKVNQKGKLDGRSGCDGMLFPHLAGSSGVSPPR